MKKVLIMVCMVFLCVGYMTGSENPRGGTHAKKPGWLARWIAGPEFFEEMERTHQELRDTLRIIEEATQETRAVTQKVEQMTLRVEEANDHVEGVCSQRQ